MRIHLKTTRNTEKVPFDYLSRMTGILHKWIGNNDLHDHMSLYSFSSLDGSRKVGNSINFEYGASWFISTIDKEVINKIIKSIQNDTEFLYGMRITEITLQEDPDLTDRNRFVLASPVFIKRTIGKEEKHYSFQNHDLKELAQLMTETAINKLAKAGISDNTLSIEFDPDYINKKYKIIKFRNNKLKCNMCPVIITAKPETKQFIWNVGVGNSTGIGFGAIK